MALTPQPLLIIWSPRAIKTYDNIIRYIQEKFTDKEVKKFVQTTSKILYNISLNPYLFRASEKEKHKHIVVISRQTTLYYRYKPHKKQVELLLFWDTRQNPKRLKI